MGIPTLVITSCGNHECVCWKPRANGLARGERVTDYLGCDKCTHNFMWKDKYENIGGNVASGRQGGDVMPIKYGSSLFIHGDTTVSVDGEITAEISTYSFGDIQRSAKCTLKKNDYKLLYLQELKEIAMAKVLIDFGSGILREMKKKKKERKKGDNVTPFNQLGETSGYTVSAALPVVTTVVEDEVRAVNVEIIKMKKEGK